MSWMLSSEEDTRAAQNDLIAIHKALAEIYSSLQRWLPTLRKVVFASILSRFRAHLAKHESMLLPPSASVDSGLLPNHPPAITSRPFLTFFARERLLENFFEGLLSNSLRLLVAVSGLLSKVDHESLCPFLWGSCLTQVASEIQTSVGSHLAAVHLIDFGFVTPQATFLIMQCAEKAPAAVFSLIKGDITRFAFGKMCFYEETFHAQR